MMSNPELNVFAQTDFRNQRKRFGIKLDDRRRHMYVIGKTGMGKSTMLENMVVNDMWAGHGLALIDPHGDTAEKVIDFVPPHRVKDVVYFNPADTEFPIGFNILESVNPDHRHLIASGLMGVFKKLWPDVWSPRMEYILNNTVLSLLECPRATLLSINRLLADQRYRKNVVARLTDPVVKAFWVNEFDRYDDKYKKEAIAPIQNKSGQFLSASIIRNIVSQPKSTVNLRDIMDSGKIFIVNLSKGRIGEDASRLIGGMIITKLQLAAMERVDMPEAQRRDFFLYVDEFQNFSTESFANILSEARKYRLGLVMAHQYIAQLDEKVADAVFGNVGTVVTYRVGADDAEHLEKEFSPVFTKEDIVNLPKFHVYLKLMIDGVASQPFSAESLGPIGERTGSAAEVIAHSRKSYTLPRAEVEERIRQWSLGSAAEDYSDDPLAVDAASEPASAAHAAPHAPAQAAAPKKEKNTHLPPQEDWFPAICDRCGTDTTVPFPPDGKRRIYCKDCYKFRHEDEAAGQPSVNQPAPKISAQPPRVVAQPQHQQPRATAPVADDAHDGDEDGDDEVEESAPTTPGQQPSADGQKKRRRRRRKKKSGGNSGTLVYDAAAGSSDTPAVQ